ncbi:hypothetical protein ENUP19_0341G0006 [Entamoeba nuttalli]|uniref:Armadillo repeat-containing protein n=2 Tax=Entamoeba nuttalli TaxID=412467 RepID=K2H655_ENTNP|nr:hypothetical protein ENU1_039080 [Entamoeba nuttalli P19]EKE41942.1 hypothetical protein ENU1_039080 [Entamoeba nuttalli P19]|eukprot:XP_008855721.1 hypothetical protein ENU1_039080 [Entamoeba nuttalli P19]
MEKIVNLLTNIEQGIDIVENMKELEISISDDKSNQIKMYCIQKGLIEFCSNKMEDFKSMKRECLCGMCSLLVSVLMYSEVAKKKMITCGIGKSVCEIIRVIHYHDETITNITLNDLLRLCWGLMTVADFTVRRSLVTKNNIKKVLKSYDRITDDETTVTALNLMSALSIDDYVIPFFVSTGMIEQCINLGKKWMNSANVMKALCIFIANTIFTETEYAVAKKVGVNTLLINITNNFSSNDEVISSLISAIRSVANSSDEASQEFINTGIYQQLFTVAQGKSVSIQEKLMNFLFFISQNQSGCLIQMNVVPYITQTLKQMCDSQPLLDKSKESLLPLMRNILGILLHICFDESQVDVVINSGILSILHQAMELTIHDKVCQSTGCSIIQCLALKEQNNQVLFKNGLVDDVVIALEKHLKKKDVALSAIGAGINLAQNGECANELVEKGIVDLFITLHKRFPEKKQLNSKMITCVMNILIDEVVAKKISEQTLPFVQEILLTYSHEQSIVLQCLSCIISLVKAEVTSSKVIISLEDLFKNLDLNDKQINNKLLQLICSISVNKKLALTYITSGTIEFVISNAKRLFDYKDIFLNSTACLINFSCYNELHPLLLKPSLFLLFNEAATKYGGDAKVCGVISNCCKNLSILESSRKIIIANNFQTTIAQILAKHRTNEDIFKACIGCLWNLSIDPAVTPQMIELNVIHFCKRALEDTFKTNQQVLNTIIGFLMVVSNNEQARMQIKSECLSAISGIQISDSSLKQRQEKLIQKITS